jgi:hypothetical protein
MSIRAKRVLWPGLAAGLIVNLSAITMVPAVGSRFDEALAARGLPPLAPGAMAFFSLVSLALGVVLVWLYAAVRPRLGPGPRTAATVAALVWLVGYLLPNVALTVYGFLPAGLTAIGTLWGLGELLVAGLAGAWLYREEPA